MVTNQDDVIVVEIPIAGLSEWEAAALAAAARAVFPSACIRHACGSLRCQADIGVTTDPGVADPISIPRTPP